ncbi:eukaryotic translation initiation factor 5C [Trametes versicolor FP-101664 SS1]|uniref:eukaryotic translation initiation factor 5C n=1 Tax=Trametes versicolor (strain FP-101664) TaxID=717944 RepID=UPI00046223FA|nr:eukaryotic translation initiation factor 5C [Trametes versicolor FP-101664 SS1]EIW63552.1 eukaryotic translation initiation factor 5C [Trametes versicolor FP-101664 SS1]
MSQQSAAPKPTLQGVRIRARKGAVKAHAKHEPNIFRDQVFKHLENVPPSDFEAVTNKLVQAGGTLEYLKYADALFELLFVGGLLQPGGQYVEDGAPLSPFSVLNAKEPVEVADVKQYVEVMNKLIRRYKYLQRPLEQSVLPNLFQYMNRWPEPQREKIVVASGLLMAQGIASASALQSLTKDHLIKNDLSANVITLVFRAYLTSQPMEHLAAALKRGGIKDLPAFFPDNKRDDKTIDEHFRKAGLPQVAEWWTKRQYASLKETVITQLKEMLENGDSHADIVTAIRTRQEEQPLPETELVSCIWQGLISSIEWSARQDQNEALALREITNFADIIEPFCNGPKTEVALINTVQVYSYEDTRIIKAFPQILKVLYNKDCISDQAIIYWHQKGSKPQGRQHFLQSAAPLVKFLQEQESDDEEEE